MSRSQVINTTQPYHPQDLPKIKGRNMPIKIRPIRICGDVAYVPLTQGYEAIIDTADVSLVKEYKWYAAKRTHSVYAARNDYSGVKYRNVLLHRTIMGEPDGLQIDHYDSDGLNNKRENLRVATRSQNAHNMRKLTTNSSGFKGVYLEKSRSLWVASIKLNNEKIFLGRFTTPEEAHAAYCLASEKYHGEFGRTE